MLCCLSIVDTKQHYAVSDTQLQNGSVNKCCSTIEKATFLRPNARITGTWENCGSKYK